jgi:photosystem II stability/assembly factor-like uncharacterized protein
MPKDRVCMKSASFLIRASCLLVLACSSTPQLARWEFIGGPYAQTISTVFVDEHNKSHLLAGLTTGDVYSSMNEGLTWTKLSTIQARTSISRFIQHPDDVRRFFAATDSGLFVSTNTGIGWAEIAVDHSSSGASRSLAIDPYNAKVMYTGIASHGIYKTTDGGDSWRPSNNGLDSLSLTKSDVHDIKIDPLRPDNLYAAMGGIGVVRSTDGGTSWTKLTSIIGSGGITPTSIVINAKSPNTLCFGMEAGSIYRSVDGGQVWSPTRFGTGSNRPVNLVTHPTNPDVLYAGTENDLLASTDFGITWKSIANELPRVATSLTVSPGGPQPALYAYGEGIGLSRSTNNGVTWIPTQSPLGGSTVTAIAGNKRGDRLYAVVGASVHRWTPPDQKWTSASSGLTGGPISSITINTDSSSIIHVGTETGICGTMDGGASWSAGSQQLRGKTIGLISAHPIFATRILVNSENELFVSTNTGGTWNPAKPLNDRHRVHSFTYSPHDAGLVFGATTSSGVIMSTNGGLSWESSRYGLTSNDLRAITLDDKDKQTIYAWTTYAEGYRSTNQGLVWDRYSSPWQTREHVYIIFDRYNPSEALALVGTRELYYSRSGGGTWFAIPTDTLRGEMASAYWNSNTASLYVGIRQVGVYRMVLKEYLRRLFEE